MCRKTALMGLVLALLLSSVFMALFARPVRAPKTWTVDDNGPADFSTIQAAINASSPGDTVQVASGTYYEHVIVNKSLTLVGENSITTVVDGNGTGIVVHITASNVEIRGFTIRNGMMREGYFFGIWVYRSGGISNVIIRNNIISNNYVGIDVVCSDNNVVSGNTVKDNQYGIWLHISSGNIVSDNKVSSNWLYGIYLFSSNSNEIVGNTISYTYSNVTKSSYGVYIGNISGNNILYHNNFVNNTIQAYDSGTNVWDNGYPSGGNYWSDYSGADEKSGPNQDRSGSDGIGDTPYVIDANSRDSYPLAKPYGGIRDIGITSVTTSKTVVGQGYSLRVSLTIVNYGIYNETSVSITVYANAIPVMRIMCAVTRRSSTTVTFNWDTTGFALGFYTITAKAAPLPGEIDLVDNTYIDGRVHIATPGDINGDGHVNFLDLSILAQHWFSIPTYDLLADINMDGFINSLDLSIMAQHWLKGPLD